MSSHINTANAFAMAAIKDVQGLAAECIHSAKMLEERDQEIKELKSIIERDSGCEENARLREENKKLTKRLEKTKELSCQHIGVAQTLHDAVCKDHQELQKALEPLQEAMDGWTGVCDYKDVVDYVETEKHRIQERDEVIENLNGDVGVIYNTLTTWGDEDDANKEYPPSKKQLLDLAEKYAQEQEPW